MAAEIKNVSGIPVVDFSAMNVLRQTRPDINDRSVVALTQQIYDALSTVGFVYLKNHGIPDEKVKAMYKVAGEFFAMDEAIKGKCAASDTNIDGWECLEAKGHSPYNPMDLRETFNVREKSLEKATCWPTTEIPEFRTTFESMFTECRTLSFRVLAVMEAGLGLIHVGSSSCVTYQFLGRTLDESFDEEGFLSRHSSALRLNYYPSLENIQVKPNQSRIGEHSDFGTLTLLFQDNMGGLEVQNVNGDFIPAKPIEGTCLVNIGDLMQRLTADKLKATRHRVQVPTDENKRNMPRYSIALFVAPLPDVVIRCMDGSERYPPVKAGHYIRSLVDRIHQNKKEKDSCETDTSHVTS